MSKDRTAEIEARLNAATPGPWEFSGPDLEQCAAGWNTVIENTVTCMSYCYGGSVEQTVKPEDKAFIANAPEDVRYLLAQVAYEKARAAYFKYVPEIENDPEGVQALVEEMRAARKEFLGKEKP